MSGYQKVIVLGRLGRKPEIKYSQSGMAICNFSLATSRKKKDGQEITSWHRCTAFSKTAENIEKYLDKGQELLVEGELSYGQYDKDGQTHYTTDIIVNQMSFVGGRKQGGQQTQQRPEQQPLYDNSNVSETEIPF